MYLYTYADGSGNYYRVAETSVKYEPITPVESSSGVYSGGEPMQVPISKEQRQQLIGLFDTAFCNRTFRVEKRTLGSAEIRRIPIDDESGEETKKVIIAMRSPDKKDIENFLDELKKKNRNQNL